MPKVLIVDDSRTARLALTQAMRGDPDLLVVGEAATAAEALQLIDKLQPDVVTMDVFLRFENGIEVTAAIMSRAPRPILVITGVNPKDPQLLYAAIEAGALDVTSKLPAPSHPAYEAQRRLLLRLIKSLAAVPVVHRFRGPAPTTRKPVWSGAPVEAETRVVVLGASTGGPPVLHAILKDLTAPFPLPVVIVQHITAGFTAGLADWLAAGTRHAVTVVDRATPIGPGRVYLSGENQHLVFTAPGLIAPDLQPPIRFQRPAIDLLFQSAARHHGAHAAGVLMTGMGSDGAEGLLAMRQAGAVTLAQQPDTCAVDSMPSSAISLGAVQQVLTAREIATELTARARRGRP